MRERTLLKQLTDYGLAVQVADNKIRLSPRQLINDRVLTFVRTHKNDLLCALYDEHHERKRILRQGRIEVLRVILRRYLKPGTPGVSAVTATEVEEFLDDVLRYFNYDLERAITHYDNITPAPILTCQCGLRPPFCTCSGIPIAGVVTCNSCKHFTPDNIGDGTGIGECVCGVEWTMAALSLQGRMPLYRYANRRCNQFKTTEEH